MPQRPLTPDEFAQLEGTPFAQIKKILEERRVPGEHLVPEYVQRDMRFRLSVQRCEYDHRPPYLCIQEATNNIGFLFTPDGQLTHIVNYK